MKRPRREATNATENLGELLPLEHICNNMYCLFKLQSKDLFQKINLMRELTTKGWKDALQKSEKGEEDS